MYGVKVVCCAKSFGNLTKKYTFPLLGTNGGTFEMVIRIFVDDDDDGHLEVDQLSGLLAAKPMPPSM